MALKCLVDEIVERLGLPHYAGLLPWVLRLPPRPVQLWPKHCLHSQRNQSENSSVRRRCTHILNYERPAVDVEEIGEVLYLTGESDLRKLFITHQGLEMIWDFCVLTLAMESRWNGRFWHHKWCSYIYIPLVFWFWLCIIFRLANLVESLLSGPAARENEQEWREIPAVKHGKVVVWSMKLCITYHRNTAELPIKSQLKRWHIWCEYPNIAFIRSHQIIPDLLAGNQIGIHLMYLHQGSQTLQALRAALRVAAVLGRRIRIMVYS